jgi:hypothetical protein
MGETGETGPKPDESSSESFPAGPDPEGNTPGTSRIYIGGVEEGHAAGGEVGHKEE